MAISVLALGALSACSTQQAITKIDARQIGETASRHVVIGQLEGALIPMPFRRGGTPTHRLSDMWFRTAVRSSGVRDLCRYEDVVIYFNPVESDHGARTRVRAVTLASTPMFSFLAAPASSEPDWLDSEAEVSSADSRCSALTPGSERFFKAQSEEDAVFGYKIAQTALSQLEARNSGIVVSCEENAPCDGLIAEARSSALEEIRRCDDADCAIADYASIELKIFFRDPAHPEQVTRVVASEVVTTADQRAD